MYYFFIYAFFSLISGILLSTLYSFSIPVYIPLSLLLISFFIDLRISKVIIFVSIFLLGIALNKSPKIQDTYINPAFIQCKVSSIPYFSERFTVFPCYVFNSDKNFLKNQKITVYLKEENRQIFLFSQVSFFGKVLIENKEIKAMAYKNFIQVRNNNFYLFAKLKNFLINRYSLSSLNSRTYNLGLALIFGEKGYLSYKEKNRFINAGTSHLLAISGMHIGIILSLILFLFSFNRRLSYGIGIGLLSVYPFFTGLHIPVIRASIMGVLYLVSKIKYLKVEPINILFFVGFVVLIFSPKAIYQPGFQLSFIAVLGIILYLELILKNFKNRYITWIYQSIMLSIIATIFTAPVVMYHFGKFSIATILATPVLILILFPYLFFSIINLFTFFSIALLVKIMDLIGYLFLKTNDFFAGLGLSQNGFAPSLLMVIIFLLLATGIRFLKIPALIKAILLIFSFLIFVDLSYVRDNSYRIFVFKKLKRPDWIVISPYGECFVSKKSDAILSVANKNGCKKVYSRRFLKFAETTTDIKVIKNIVEINGKLIKLKNENYSVKVQPNDN
ncbi:ComEC/Rec2 family competence protein [Persephonella sp.]|uniref:ComEC/Rec2 family competence protein n=1 Tax=Persephonella sp. TaxID=2060922 RepID=UPI00262EB411|nr:ComEC/Rec2 family competence protein [Persephonella sp.]